MRKISVFIIFFYLVNAAVLVAVFAGNNDNYISNLSFDSSPETTSHDYQQNRQRLNSYIQQQNFQYNNTPIIPTKLDLIWNYNISNISMNNLGAISSFDFTANGLSGTQRTSKFTDFKYIDKSLPKSYTETYSPGEGQSIVRKWYGAKYFENPRNCAYVEKLVNARINKDRRTLIHI